MFNNFLKHKIQSIRILCPITSHVLFFINRLNCDDKSAVVINKAFLSIVPSHHRMLPDEYDDKPKQSNRSRSPTRIPRDRSEHGDPRKSASEFTITFSLKINIRFVFIIFMFSCIVCSDFVSPRLSHVIILSAALKEEKPEGKDLLADLQDISDSERKTSTAESSMGNGWYKLEF